MAPRGGSRQPVVLRAQSSLSAEGWELRSKGQGLSQCEGSTKKQGGSEKWNENSRKWINLFKANAPYSLSTFHYKHIQNYSVCTFEVFQGDMIELFTPIEKIKINRSRKISACMALI